MMELRFQRSERNNILPQVIARGYVSAYTPTSQPQTSSQIRARTISSRHEVNRISTQFEVFPLSYMAAETRV
jgi:hypothetical protein